VQGGSCLPSAFSVVVIVSPQYKDSTSKALSFDRQALDLRGRTDRRDVRLELCVRRLQLCSPDFSARSNAAGTCGQTIGARGPTCSPRFPYGKAWTLTSLAEEVLSVRNRSPIVKQLHAGSHFKPYRLHDQLQYWRIEHDAAQSSGDVEHAARCQQFIEQCDGLADMAAMQERR
jgi:hypothetical protein